ncbi:MAG: cyclic nucleotide-binding and patatin-like phospholipase domain-containing protein [Steroidobacteraceae bacterium]|jgi:NTE family protein
MPKYFQDELLEQHLRTYLGDLDPATMTFLRSRLEWVEIAAGETLMAQGDPGDSMYISISGRLRAYVKDDGGIEHMVREMARGQIIGEMSMYTEEPRSATVVAIRDSVLVKLARADFATLLATSATMSIVLTRQIIKRLQTVHRRSDIARPITIGVLPITTGVQPLEFCRQLSAHLETAGKVQIVDAARLDRELDQSLAQADVNDTEADRRIALYLDAIEATNDYVLLVGDDHPSSWTRRCSQRCDELLLLADAAQPPELHQTEAQFLLHRHGRTEAAEFLVLLHDADERCPSGTRKWLARRPVTSHYHVRPALERDMARLARLLSGRAVGLVLAGGGARGCAHIGIYRALRERGIEIDCVGGTSIGSVMAVYVGSDRPIEDVMKIARESFSRNPTGDFNLVPLISLVKGARLRQTIARGIRQLLGRPTDVEDLWKNYYCIASNYSLASEQVIQSGDLSRAMLASIAIPGALPPQIEDGNLLCDGGTFNNFPVDVMRNMRGVGKVIGVDLGSRKRRRIEITEVPGSWSLLRDRLRARAKRRFRLPSLMAYLMNVTVLYSTSRQRENRKLTDLYFNPPLERVGMLEWNKFDSIVQHAYEHGREILNGMSAAELSLYGARAAGK